jgi:hypothetical protein
MDPKDLYLKLLKKYNIEVQTAGALLKEVVEDEEIEALAVFTANLIQSKTNSPPTAAMVLATIVLAWKAGYELREREQREGIPKSGPLIVRPDPETVRAVTQRRRRGGNRWKNSR